MVLEVSRSPVVSVLFLYCTWGNTARRCPKWLYFPDRAL